MKNKRNYRAKRAINILQKQVLSLKEDRDRLSDQLEALTRCVYSWDRLNMDRLRKLKKELYMQGVFVKF